MAGAVAERRRWWREGGEREEVVEEEMEVVFHFVCDLSAVLHWKTAVK